MKHLGVMGAAVALLALSACGAREERERKEQEATAAEKKLADARAFQEQLEQEKALLGSKLAEARAQLGKARGAYRETLAAASFLADEPSHGVTLTADMEAARRGFRLTQAAHAGDREAIAELAAQVLDDVRPCERAESEEGEAQGDLCPVCEVEPYEDACVGVETHLVTSPDWSCATLARSGEGLPPAAFCTSSVDHPAPSGNVLSPYAEAGLPTELQVVRIAFVHDGRLFANDYPAPDPSLYNPPNVEPLVSCQASTERNKCLHECDVRFDRYEDPCACKDTEYAHAYGDAEGSEAGDAEEEEEESAEVRQAREAAEAVEAARRRAEEAQRELEYQECLSSCSPEAPPAEDPEQEGGEPVPTAAQVLMSLEAVPAPGIFLVARDYRGLLKVDGAVVEQNRELLLLKHPELVALWEKRPPRSGESLGKLEEVARFDEVLGEGGKLSLPTLPGQSGPALIGLHGGKVKAFALGTQPGQAPLTALETARVCEALRAEPQRFPEAYRKACPEPVAAPPVEAAPEVPEAPADAGVAEDAGTAGTQAGEVSP